MKCQVRAVQLGNGNSLMLEDILVEVLNIQGGAPFEVGFCDDRAAAFFMVDGDPGCAGVHRDDVLLRHAQQYHSPLDDSIDERLARPDDLSCWNAGQSVPGACFGKRGCGGARLPDGHGAGELKRRGRFTWLRHLRQA